MRLQFIFHDKDKKPHPFPSEETFEDKIKPFKGLRGRGYPDNLSENILSEVKFSKRSSALQNKQRRTKDYRL